LKNGADLSKQEHNAVDEAGLQGESKLDGQTERGGQHREHRHAQEHHLNEHQGEGFARDHLLGEQTRNYSGGHHQNNDCSLVQRGSVEEAAGEGRAHDTAAQRGDRDRGDLHRREAQWVEHATLKVAHCEV